MSDRTLTIVVGIIVARMDSTRLPGKPLRQVHGRPLIDYVLDRAQRIGSLDQLILATSDREVDAPLAAHATAHGLRVQTGSADDVAGRVLEAAGAARADALVRLNGDSPFIEPALVDAAVRRLVDDPGIDLVTNVLHRSYPYGVSVEVVRVASLRNAHGGMSASDREHVTAIFYREPAEYTIVNLTSPGADLSAVRMTVDTEQDLARFGEVVDRLGPAALTAGFEQVASLYTELEGASA